MARFGNGWRDYSENKAPQPIKKNGPKYGNKKVYRHGLHFDSILEADKYTELLPLQNAGLVTIETQVNFPLAVNGKVVCTYRADFVLKWQDGTERWEVLDAKGVRTEAYRIKYKLFYALYGVEIQEMCRHKVKSGKSPRKKV